jgi:hypothetical protein
MTGQLGSNGDAKQPRKTTTNGKGWSAVLGCDGMHDGMLYGDENRQHYRVGSSALF